MTITRKKRPFQRKSAFRQFPLLDVQEPQLYRHVFPYDEVCRIEFDNQFVFIDPPSEIFITDTTFRDGQQARPPYSVDQIVDLFVATYGEEVILDPPGTGRTALLWVLPTLMGVAGLAVIATRVRRGSRDLTDEERRRVADAVREAQE